MDFRKMPIRTGGGDSIIPPKNLTIQDASSEGHPRVRIIWGTVNNLQPVEMSPGDENPCYIDVTANSQGRIYAKATGNRLKRQWTEARIINSDKELTNLPNVAYTLLGTYKVYDKSVFVISWSGGDITNDFCSLPLF